MNSIKSHKLLILLVAIISNVSSQSFNTGDFNNLEGLQIYYTSSSYHYFFGSYTGSATSITGKLYLMLQDDRATINSTGIWAGVGFGSTSMKNSDMVMCFYIPEKEFYCEDFYSNAEVTPKLDTSLGGKNDILSSSGTLEDISIGGYKSMLTFTFTKNIANPDAYDWSSFPTWQSNKQGHSGSYGKMSGRIPREHSFFTKRSSLTDGDGYVNSLTLNLNEQSQASTTTPIPTPNPNPNPTLPYSPSESDDKDEKDDDKDEKDDDKDEKDDDKDEKVDDKNEKVDAKDEKVDTIDKIYLNNISFIFALILSFILF